MCDTDLDVSDLRVRPRRVLEFGQEIRIGMVEVSEFVVCELRTNPSSTCVLVAYLAFASRALAHLQRRGAGSGGRGQHRAFCAAPHWVRVAPDLWL